MSGPSELTWIFLSILIEDSKIYEAYLQLTPMTLRKLHCRISIPKYVLVMSSLRLLSLMRIYLVVL